MPPTNGINIVRRLCLELIDHHFTYLELEIILTHLCSRVETTSGPKNYEELMLATARALKAKDSAFVRQAFETVAKDLNSSTNIDDFIQLPNGRSRPLNWASL